MTTRQKSSVSRRKGLLPLALGCISAVFSLAAHAQEGPSCTEPFLDFGDAPDTQQISGTVSPEFGFGYYGAYYPTLLSSDGARHVITGLRLGDDIDAEPDGQPGPLALGDDYHGDQCSMPLMADLSRRHGDEDGIEFLNPEFRGFFGATAVAGTVLTFRATVNGASDKGAKLSAFFDFREEGWAATHDAQLSKRVMNGTNDFTMRVPADAVPGHYAYARFRLSSAVVSKPTGLAPDGEVEDYQFTVLSKTMLGEVGGTVDADRYVRLSATLSADLLHQLPMGVASVDPESGIFGPSVAWQRVTFVSKLTGKRLCSAWTRREPTRVALRSSATAAPMDRESAVANCSFYAGGSDVSSAEATPLNGSDLVAELTRNGIVAEFDGNIFWYLAPSSGSGRVKAMIRPGKRE